MDVNLDPDMSLPVGDMSVEELLEKYKGAYASDFEAPSAAGSKASSDSEVSGDEEEETEEDESDVESNSSSSGINLLTEKMESKIISHQLFICLNADEPKMFPPAHFLTIVFHLSFRFTRRQC